MQFGIKFYLMKLQDINEELIQINKMRRYREEKVRKSIADRKYIANYYQGGQFLKWQIVNKTKETLNLKGIKSKIYYTIQKYSKIQQDVIIYNNKK